MGEWRIDKATARAGSFFSGFSPGPSSSQRFQTRKTLPFWDHEKVDQKVGSLHAFFYYLCWDFSVLREMGRGGVAERKGVATFSRGL